MSGPEISIDGRSIRLSSDSMEFYSECCRRLIARPELSGYTDAGVTRISVTVINDDPTRRNACYRVTYKVGDRFVPGVYDQSEVDAVTYPKFE